jgi:hypothetical protein
MPSANQVFKRIDALIEPFQSYKNALEKLSNSPRGYTLCFAFHYVYADIFNGGISQLYGNSTWSLMLDAIEAAEAANEPTVARSLREIVYYYHRKGRSKFKRQVSDDYFKSIPKKWNKTLENLDDELFKLDDECANLVAKLCKSRNDLFTE